MTDLLTHEKVNFVARENAPSPLEVLEANGQIINEVGNVALIELRMNAKNPDSLIELDESGETPVLRLREAIAITAFGSIDEASGRFIPSSATTAREIQLVSGTYSGPNSGLEVTELI